MSDPTDSDEDQSAALPSALPFALPPATSFARPPPLPPPLPPEASRNYFLRHWRGELSLPVSYWVNGILGGLLIGITVAVLAVITHRQGEARPLLWLFNLVAIWLLLDCAASGSATPIRRTEPDNRRLHKGGIRLISARKSRGLCKQRR